MPRMRAYGWGERRVAPHSTPSPPRSDENGERALHLGDPVGSHGRGAEHVTRALALAGVDGTHSATHLLAAGHGHLLHGGEDPAVAGAAADVAGELLPDLDLGRLGVAVEQVVGGDDQARRAEAALHGTGLDERPLHVARRAGLGEPLDRDDRLARPPTPPAPGTSTPAGRRRAPSTSRTRPARRLPWRPSGRAARAARTAGSRPPSASATSWSTPLTCSV